MCKLFLWVRSKAKQIKGSCFASKSCIRLDAMKPRRDVRHAPHSKRRKWKRRNDRSLINCSAAKPALPFHPGVPSFPLADDVLKVLGEQLDAGKEERQIFGEVAQQLWKGNFVRHSPADQM